MKAIIMAGGKGTRLMPLTDSLPKPMMPILDEPIIYYITRLLKSYGFNQIGVTLGYMPDTIINGLSKSFNNNFEFYVEEQPLGTAGSVAAAREFLQNDAQPFVVISGDALTNINLAAMLDIHIRSSAAITMAVQTMHDVSEYGVVVADTDNYIQDFQEKPAPGTERSNLINCGIYIINPWVLDMVPYGSKFDFSRDLFPAMLSQGMPIKVYQNDAYWCDIGNISAYHQANMDMLFGLKGLDCFTKHKNIIVDPQKRVYAGERINIGLGVGLKGGVVLGSGAAVTDGTVLHNCVIGRHTVLEEGGYISGQIITPNHQISVSPVPPGVSASFQKPYAVQSGNV